MGAALPILEKRMSMKWFLPALILFLSVVQAFPTDRNDQIKEALSMAPYNPIRASELLNSIIAQYPDWDYPYLVLADIYDRNYVIHDAIQAFEKGLSLNTQIPEFMRFKVLYRLGDLYARLGRLTNAGTYFRKAYQLKKDDKQLKISIETLDTWQKALLGTNSRERIRNLDRVLQKRPNWIDCELELAKSLVKEGSFFAARKGYENALSYTPVWSICVPGTYKGGSWNPGLNPMKYLGKGLWEIKLPLLKGTNEYKFVINQKITISDPINTNTTGPLVNSLVIGENDNDTIAFRYYTLPLDDIFIRILTDLENLRTRAEQFFLANFERTAPADQLQDHTFIITNAATFKELYLAGSFNDFLTNWKERTNWTFQRTDSNVFRLTVHLKPGKYLYETVANNRARFIDWTADDFYVDENGHGNVFAAVSLGGICLKKNGLKPVSVRYKPAEKLVSMVHAAGSFNYWGGTACGLVGQMSNYGFPLEGPDSEGFYTLTHPLPEGRMQYKFVVNGSIWHSDPNNENRENDGWGGDNSVITIGSGDVALARDQIPLRSGLNRFHFTLDFNKFPKIAKVLNTGVIQLLPPENSTMKRFDIYSAANSNLFFSSDLTGFYANKSATIDWIGTERTSSTEKTPVSFRFQKTNISAVYIAGDFNEWNETVSRMAGPTPDGWWTLDTNLSPGIYQYKLVIDYTNGRREWQNDPNNPNTKPDGMGGLNSLVLSGFGENRFSYNSEHPQETGKALFRLFAPSATNVEVSGNFNDWSIPAIPLHGPDAAGWWETNLDLPKAAWQYKFIVNRETWITDPSNQLILIDNVGNVNSIIRVMSDDERKNLQKVHFRFRSPSARLVELTGDFYGRDFIHIQMTGPGADGWWETTLNLDKGNYLYRFSVIESSGSVHLETDPMNRFFATDGAGNIQSIISVGLSEDERKRISKLSGFPKELKVLGVYLYTQESESREMDRLKFYSLAKLSSWKNQFPMKPGQKPGVFEAEIQTESRRLQYNYLILTSYNGHLSLVDPDADDFSPNGNGGYYFVKFGDRSD